tara:strand:- start:7042 stop:8106 length:1065 start_codon:yes stop_codon:yes gene_type:complete
LFALLAGLETRMSENKVEGEDSTPQSTEAVNKNIGLLDADGLADQLEMLYGESNESTAENVENNESPPVEEPVEEIDSEGEAETDLSQVKEPSTEVDLAGEEIEEVKEELPHKGLLKRIDKLTAKRKDAESKVDTLEDEIKILRAELENKEELKEVPVHKSNNPYAHLKSVSAVEKEIEQAEEIMEWAEDNSDGVEVTNSKGEEIEYSREDVSQIKKNARRALRKHLPEQANYLREEIDVSQKVEQIFPYWKDRSSNGYQEAMEIIKNRPSLKQYPTWKADVTMFQLGLQAYKEMTTDKQPKAKPVKAPNQPSAPTEAPVVSKPAQAKSASARKNFNSEPTADALANVLETDYL